MRKINKKGIFSFIGSFIIIFVLIILLTRVFSLVFFSAFKLFTNEKTLLENKMIILLLSTLGELLAGLIFLKFIWKKSLAYVWIKKEKSFAYFSKGFLLGFIQISIFLIINLALANVSFKSVNKDILNIYFILYLIGFIIQSTSEEFLVRGLLMKYLSEKFSTKIALFVPAILFGLLHLANPGVTLVSTINTMLVGILYGIMLLKTENLLFTCGAHSAWNFTMGIVYGLPVSGLGDMKHLFTFDFINKKALGGIYGPEGTFLVCIILFVSILYFYFYKKRGIENG